MLEDVRHQEVCEVLLFLITIVSGLLSFANRLAFFFILSFVTGSIDIGSIDAIGLACIIIPHAPRSTVRSGSSAAGFSHEFVNSLQVQLRESVAQMEGLEKERDFYFAKVRHSCIDCTRVPCAVAIRPKSDY